MCVYFPCGVVTGVSRYPLFALHIGLEASHANGAAEVLDPKHE